MVSRRACLRLLSPRPLIQVATLGPPRFPGHSPRELLHVAAAAQWGRRALLPRPSRHRVPIARAASGMDSDPGATEKEGWQPWQEVPHVPRPDARTRPPGLDFGEVVFRGTEIAEKERVLVIDAKGGKHILRMQRGKELHLYKGCVSHSVIASAGFGGSVKTHKGALLRVHRVTLDDYVLSMPRSATVVYPKDAACILMLLDLRPGARVLEAGSGSGGLTLYLARALGGAGTILSFDSRATATHQAARNVRDWLNEENTQSKHAHSPTAEPDHTLQPQQPLGSTPPRPAAEGDLTSPVHTVCGNIHFYTGDVAGYPLEAESLDGAVLDMMEPWLAVSTVEPALKADRSLVCVCPNITQVTALIAYLQDCRLGLCLWRSLEVSHR